MYLPDRTMFINPTIGDDNPTFGVWVARSRPKGGFDMVCLRTFGTIHEALSYIEGRCEERAWSVIRKTVDDLETEKRNLVDHEDATGS